MSAVAAAFSLSGCTMTQNMGGPERRTMLVTAYCPCRQCNGKYVGQGAADGSALRAPQPGLLSSDTVHRPWMAPVRAGLPWLAPPRDGSIAADTRYYPFGTRIYVPGWGWGTVNDRGSAIQGPNRLDVFVSRHSQTTVWGKRQVECEIHQPGASPG